MYCGGSSVKDQLFPDVNHLFCTSRSPLFPNCMLHININAFTCHWRRPIILFHRHIHMREARTAKRLAVVVGFFITCWLPFFIAYLITPFLNSEIPGWLYEMFTWLGKDKMR